MRSAGLSGEYTFLDRPYLTDAEVARLLGMCTATFQRNMRKGWPSSKGIDITLARPYFMPGGSRRWVTLDVLRVIREREEAITKKTGTTLAKKTAEKKQEGGAK